MKKQNTRLAGDELLASLVRQGLVPDTDITDKQYRKIKQQMAAQKYHNTKCLLINYHKLCWSLQAQISAIAEEITWINKEEPSYDLKGLRYFFSQLDLYFGNQPKNKSDQLEQKLNRIRLSVDMLVHLNDALNQLRKLPDNGETMYRILVDRYIREKKVSQIAKEHNTSTQTIYYKLNHGIEDLSVILWDVPDNQLELWMSVINYLKSQNASK